MNRAVKLIALILAMILIPCSAFARSPWTTVQDYGDQAVSKLGFGLRNILIGWQDIPVETYRSLEKGELVFIGLAKGTVKTLGRAVGGAAHVLTFPVTSVDVPLPENGEKLWPY